MTGFIIPSNDKFLLFLLNSKITKFVMNKIAISRRGGYNEYKVQYLSKIPLKDIQDSEKKKYREVVDIIVNNNDKLYNLLNKFQTYLKQKFKLEKLPKSESKIIKQFIFS